jgi:hypothetical protein
MGKAYETVKKIADRLGLPEHYKDDLIVHDRKYLEGCDGQFLWSVRSTGTWAQRADALCEIAKGHGGFGFGRHHGSAWRDVVSGQARSFLCFPGRCKEITGRPERIRTIMAGWLKDCRAPAYRKAEVLEGLRRRRR